MGTWQCLEAGLYQDSSEDTVTATEEMGERQVRTWQWMEAWQSMAKQDCSQLGCTLVTAADFQAVAVTWQERS